MWSEDLERLCGCWLVSPLQDMESGRDDDAKGIEGVENEKYDREGLDTERRDSKVLRERGRRHGRHSTRTANIAI